MRYLGITIPDRAAPAEALVDLFAASQARRKKMIKKPRASVLAVLDPQQVEPTIVKPAIVKVNPIQATVVKSKSSKKKVSPKRELPETIENEVPEEESDKDNWLVSQKWTRIAEAPKKAVEKIAQIEKTPEEKERHDALIAYL